MSNHPTPPQGDPAGSAFVRADVVAAKAAAKAERDRAFSATVAGNAPVERRERVTVPPEVPEVLEVLEVPEVPEVIEVPEVLDVPEVAPAPAVAPAAKKR